MSNTPQTIKCDNCGATLDRNGCEIFDVPHCLHQTDNKAVPARIVMHGEAYGLSDSEINAAQVALDEPKDDTREIIASLMRHALENARLSEITASRNNHWHVAEECRNIAISIDKLLSSIPQSL